MPIPLRRLLAAQPLTPGLQVVHRVLTHFLLDQMIRARTTHVKPDGQPGAGRYTAVWARRWGRWVCVAANLSRG